MKYTGTSTRAKPRGRVAMYIACLRAIMCFISRRPRTYRVIINRKELYDFYYTAITLTTGYKLYYNIFTSVHVHAYNNVKVCKYTV